jgi:glucokinase
VPPSPRDELLLGIDIGATKIAAGLGRADGTILHRRVIATTRLDPDRLLDDVSALVAELRRTRPGEPVTIGVGICGLVQPGTGNVARSIALGWPRPVPLGDVLAARTGCRVVVDNDVNAGAVGEQTSGAGAGVDDFVYVSVGTGVGAGIVIGGRLHRGASGAAGEVGHMVIDLRGPTCPCGNRGCLEVLASGKAVGQTATADVAAGAQSPALSMIAAGGEPITARDVFAAAADGDAYALDVVRHTGEFLAIAVANLVNLFDPGRVVLGGGLTHTGHLLLDAVRLGLERWTACVGDATKIVVPAKLGADTGLAGAMAVALRGTAEAT